MAFTKREERTISGKGLLRVPTNAYGHRYYILYAQVLRRPKQEYRNLNYNPYKSRYATLNFMRRGYVVEEKVLEYTTQSWSFVPDAPGQALIALKCAYDGILQSFVNQNVALGLIVTGVTNTIIDYNNLDLMWDEVRVVCNADSAIVLSLYSEVYYTCSEQNRVSDRGNADPGLAQEITPGTPINVPGGISPAYDGATDGGNTVPFNTDSNPPPPPPFNGQKVMVAFQFTYNDPTPKVGNSQSPVYGPVGSVRIKAGNNMVAEIFARGQGNLAAPLPTQQWHDFVSFSVVLTGITVTSVTPI